MSPRAWRPGRPQPEPVPAPSAPATWEEWLGPPRTFAYFQRIIARAPWTLDWQHNAKAPLPPGWIWGRCLCCAWAVRPPDFHGQVRDKEWSIRYTVGPGWTIGDDCATCGAPLQRVKHRSDPYPWSFDLQDPEAGGQVIEAGNRFRAGSGEAPDLTATTVAWSVDLRTGGLVPRRSPPPLERWSRFPSMAAEKAWVAAQRRERRTG